MLFYEVTSERRCGGGYPLDCVPDQAPLPGIVSGERRCAECGEDVVVERGQAVERCVSRRSTFVGKELLEAVRLVAAQECKERTLMLCNLAAEQGPQDQRGGGVQRQTAEDPLSQARAFERIAQAGLGCDAFEAPFVGTPEPGFECTSDEVEELLAGQEKGEITESALNLLPFGAACPRALGDVVSEAGMQNAHEQQGCLGTRRCFGNLLQEEDIFIGILGRELKVLAELVHDQQEAARSAGGSLDKQVGGCGARGCWALEQSACPACDGAGSRAACKQRVQDCRQKGRSLRLHQHRLERLHAAKVSLAQLASLRVPGLGIREQIGQEQGEGGFAGAVGAGQGPGPSPAVSPEFLQDLAGEPQQCRGGKVVARIVRGLPVVRQVYRTMESPANVYALVQRRRRESGAIHVPLSP